jgi:hypothetical protein
MDNPFLIERYKYVLAQKQELNKTSFKVIGIYQALIVAIAAVDFQIVKESFNKNVSVAACKVGVVILSIASIFIAVMCIALLISGLKSWIKYRSDESEIELSVFGRSRPNPKWRDALRWYETYLILAVAVTACCFLAASIYLVIPSIR